MQVITRIAALALASALSVPLVAADFCVSNAAELQSALTTAAFNLEDDFVLLVRGAYQGNFTYASFEGRNLAIRGGYDSGCGGRVIDPANTVLDAMGSGRVLLLSTTEHNVAFELEGITLANGNVPGNEQGGGLYAPRYLAFVIEKCWFLNNTGQYGGGATLSSFDGNETVTIQYSRFEGNTARYNGGGLSLSTYGGGSWHLVENEFVANTAGQGSGAWLHNYYGRATILEGNTFSGNGGGGLYLYTNGAGPELRSNTFSGNTSPGGPGGGLQASLGNDSAGIIADCTFENNVTAGSNGGGVAANGQFTIERSRFLNNTAAGQGGAIHMVKIGTTFGPWTIDSSEFLGNTAASGGAFYFDSMDHLTLRNNVVVRNQSTTYEGGALWLKTQGMGLTMTNNTITGNAALVSRGGGVYLSSADSEVDDVYNNIIWNNASAVPGADLALENDGDNNLIPTLINLFHNDFDQSAAGLWIEFPFPIHGSNLNNVNPLFVNPPADDYHLQPASAAIGTGDNAAPGLPPLDKDGGPRIRGAIVDLGAYEFATPGPVADLRTTSMTGPVLGLSTAAVVLSATVTNDGDQNAGAFRVGFYFSVNPVIDPGDAFAGYCEIPGIAAGASRSCLAGPVVPGSLPPGMYYIGAIADYQGAIEEPIETNNARPADSGPIEIRGGSCLLELSLTYDGANLRPAFNLATLEPLRWSVGLVTHGGVAGILRVDLSPIPVTYPISFPIPLPPAGNVAMVTALTSASGGIRCFDYAVVDTGGAGLSVSEVLGIARRAGYPIP